jgi:activator of HSP90 ATPase
MYGGIIEGEYVTIDENKRIEMKWKFRDWDQYSDVVINFEDSNDVKTYKGNIILF